MAPKTDSGVTKSSTRNDSSAPHFSDPTSTTPLRQSQTYTSATSQTESQRTWVAAALPTIHQHSLPKSAAQTASSSPNQNTYASSNTTDAEDKKSNGRNTKSPPRGDAEEPQIWHDVDLNSEDEREYDMAEDDDLNGEPEVLDTEAVREEQKEEAMERRRKMFPPESPSERDSRRHG